MHVLQTRQVDLSNNVLCGITRWGGTYTSEGISAIADALRVNASLTRLDARGNALGDEGRAVLQDAVKNKPGFKLQL